MILVAWSVRSSSDLSGGLLVLSFLPLVFYDLPLPWPATSSSLTRRRQPTAKEVRATVQVEPWQTDHDREEVVSCPRGGVDLDVGSTFFLRSRWIRRGGD
jgi:hypothetical protein